jgi:hypothetical protein
MPALGAGSDPVGGDERAVQAHGGLPGGAGAVQDVVEPGAWAAITSSASRR